YALYSKNKPKSDSLLASHGNAFFRFKQMQLGDKMNLASYLLKPIQRMSKYALLLKDLIKKCGEAQEQELAYLRAAEKMVRFQLRHGNDLLAMDAIRDCDVNLKEQGQLMRQDEFSISLGRRKCKRHIFLFEDLILFSKPKRVEGALDVYVYKRSFKARRPVVTSPGGLPQWVLLSEVGRVGCTRERKEQALLGSQIKAPSCHWMCRMSHAQLFCDSS
ncbi:hypothetical protein Chor_013261, partial [Crotalus horridus]